MMWVNVLINFLFLKHVVVGIPPQVVIPPSTSGDINLQEDVTNLKYVTKALTVQMSKWNTLFLTSLEPRISSSATLLSSIDSNIKNLQGRAHVWDTFQLHVSAWNEQLATLDRKVDIISKGQEKLLSLESKISAMINLDYKLDRILKGVDNIESDLLFLNSSLKNHGDQGLFNEFAARGIFSTIKMVEKKLDRLFILGQQNIAIKKKSEKENNRQKFGTKCKFPKSIQDLFADLSSKVDIIFDKISVSSSAQEKTRADDEYENEPNADSKEYLDFNEGSGNGESLSFQGDDEKTMKKFMRKFNKPCKITNEVIEEVLNRILNVEKNSMRILDNQANILTTVSKNWTHLLKIEKSSESSEKLNDTDNFPNPINLTELTEVLDKRFRNQNSEFEAILTDQLSVERNLKCLKTERTEIGQFTLENTQTSPPTTIESSSFSYSNLNTKSQEDEEDSATYWLYEDPL